MPIIDIRDNDDESSQNYYKFDGSDNVLWVEDGAVWFGEMGDNTARLCDADEDCENLYKALKAIHNNEC